MSRHTLTIREIMNGLNGKELLEKALSTYPLYTPQKKIDAIPDRAELNRRLLNVYKNREIGFETAGWFLDELENTMCEIMPYYNEMYKTVEIMANLENPFDNVDFTESYEETRTGTAINEDKITSTSSNDAVSTTSSTGTSNTEDDSITTSHTTEALEGESSSKNVKSNTPQDSLNIPVNSIESVKYADEVNWNKATTDNTTTTDTNATNQSTTNTTTDTNTEQTTESTSNTTSDSNGTRTTEDIIKHTFSKKGNQGVNTYAHDMREYRTSSIDVTHMIINDERISELFLRVY